jgi:hypothetical protein
MEPDLAGTNYGSILVQRMTVMILNDFWESMNCRMVPTLRPWGHEPPHVLVVERFGVCLKIGRPWTPQSVHDFIQASFFPIGIPNLQNSAKTSTKAIIYIASDH